MLRFSTDTCCCRRLVTLVYSPPHACSSTQTNGMTREDLRTLRELLQQGKPERVLEQYREFRARQPSPIALPIPAYFTLFQACTLTKNWHEGRQLHDQVKMNKRFPREIRLQRMLLNMYAKAGDFNTAEQILADLLTSKSLDDIDPSAFSALMTGYNIHQQPEKALITFERVHYPDAISYLLALQACTQLKDLKRGRILAEKLIQSNIDLRKEPRLQTVLFDMYGKCGDVNNAECVFATIDRPSNVHCNALLKVYNDNKMYEKAVEFYKKMKDNQPDIVPDHITFVCLLLSVAKIGRIELCQKIVDDLRSSSIHLDDILQVNLINALVKCGDMAAAQKTFDEIHQPPITAVFNALMKGYLRERKPLTTLGVFEKIVKPDSISYVMAINACAQIAMLRRARTIYEQISRQFPSYKQDIRIMNALIDMFGKCADTTTARQIFDEIIDKDIVSYNTLINAYGLNGDGLNALTVYNTLHLTPDDQTHSIIINASSHSGLVNEAEQIFHRIPIIHRNIFIYATMIDTLCRASKMDEAELLLAEYENKHERYAPMYMTLLSAHARRHHLDKVMELRDRIERYFPNEPGYVSSATILLANTHAFQGNLNEAARLRTEAIAKNLSKMPGISWTETSHDNRIHEFIAHDKRHEKTEEIYEELRRMSEELARDGHVTDQRWITSDRDNFEENDPLHSHSERLALAYQLFLRRTMPNIEPIQITKNLRMCGDCHETFKRFTRLRPGLVILTRDRTRQHKFQDGHCSCDDQF